MGYAPQTMYRHELRQKTKCRNERTRESKTPPEEPGAGTASGRTGKDCTEMILKHDIWAGGTLPCLHYFGALKDGLTKGLSLKIAPKRYTKISLPIICENVKAVENGRLLKE